MGPKERHLHRIPERRLGIHRRVLQHRAQVRLGLAPRQILSLLNQGPELPQHQNLILIQLGVMGET